MVPCEQWSQSIRKQIYVSGLNWGTVLNFIPLHVQACMIKLKIKQS